MCCDHGKELTNEIKSKNFIVKFERNNPLIRTEYYGMVYKLNAGFLWQKVLNFSAQVR